MSDMQLFRRKNGNDFNDGAEIWQQCRIVGEEKDGCPRADLLASWLDGRLNDGERESIESHLLHCEQCMETVVSIRRSLDGKPEKIPCSLRSIHDLVPAVDRSFSFAEVVQWLCPLRPGTVIALAGLVLLVTTSGYLGSRMAEDRLFIHRAIIAELSFDFDFSDRAESVGGRSHDAP
jgi:anti-sigma factor RsiW